METKSMYQQYKELKDMRPDAILLFRVGDNYEVYSDDAEKVSKILGITMNLSVEHSEGDGSMLRYASFIHYKIDEYLPKLIRAGNRIAICDRLEDPHTKKLVKRGSRELVNRE